MKTGILRRLALALLLVLTFCRVDCDAADSIAPASRPSVAAALEPFVESHSLAGAVTLVADKDKVLSLEAVGLADIAANRPMTTDALFWIASQSKPITATALMMLVDEGKVNVDDPVEKYLPEFKGQWLTAVARQRAPVAQEAETSDHGPQRAQPYQRTAVQVGDRRTDARPAAARRARPQLRQDAAGFRARQQMATIPTPASTPPAASSKSSAACPMRRFWTRGSSVRWA